MKKIENQREHNGEGIANRPTSESLKGTIKLLLLLEDNTIEDTSRVELDQMLSEFGY